MSVDNKNYSVDYIYIYIYIYMIPFLANYRSRASYFEIYVSARAEFLDETDVITWTT